MTASCCGKTIYFLIIENEQNCSTLFTFKPMTSSLSATNEIQIYCDDREHTLSPILAKSGSIQKRLTHGDIYFEFQGSAIALFERKTWADFVASISDGRMENLADIVATFCGTQTRFYLILEGLLGKLMTTTCRIPQENIFAKIDRLIFRDNVHVIYTVSVEHTAEVLLRMQKNMAKVLAEKSAASASACADAKLVVTKKDFTTKDYLMKLGVSDGVADAIIATNTTLTKLTILQGNAINVTDLKYATSGKSVPKKYVDALVADIFSANAIGTRLAKAGIRYKVLSDLSADTLKKFVDAWIKLNDPQSAARTTNIILKNPQAEKLASVFGK
jgi:ERCC4-type nuclease